jgi:lipoprotein NlpD
MAARVARRSWWARKTLLASCGALLAACASNEPAPVVDLSPALPRPAPSERTADADGGSYRVVRGDTLYAIAFRHGLDFRDVAAWNRIEPPYRIYAGQELHLQAPRDWRPAAAAAAPPRPAAAPAAPAANTPIVVAAPATRSATPGGAGVFEDVPESAPSAAPPTAPEQARVPAAREAASAPPAPSASTAPPAPSAGKPAPKSSPPAAAPPPIAPDSSSSAGGIAWRWPGKGALLGTFVAGEQTRQGIDIGGNAGDPVLAAADGEVVYSGNGLIGYGELIIIKHNASFLSAYGHNRKRLVQEGERIRAGQQIAEMGSSASSRDELHFEIRKNGKPVNPLDYLPGR